LKLDLEKGKCVVTTLPMSKTKFTGIHQLKMSSWHGSL
jgi:hypothetical protein